MKNQTPLIKDVKRLVANYVLQDNRCTAWPCAYVVQERQEHLTKEGYSEDKIIFYNHDDGVAYDNIEEALTSLNIDLEEDEAPYTYSSLLDEFRRDGACVETPIERHAISYIWHDVMWFFTAKEAYSYISRNKHNLCAPRTYVKHHYRSNEAELVLRSLFKIAGADFDEAYQDCMAFNSYKTKRKDKRRILRKYGRIIEGTKTLSPLNKTIKQGGQ